MGSENAPQGPSWLPPPLYERLMQLIEFCSSKPWALYGLTALVQIPAIPARWLIAYVVFLLFGIEVLGSAETTAWAAAFAPLVWSALAFKFPGKGWIWHRVIGAREPSELERNQIARALEGLKIAGELDISKVQIYVIDHPAYFSFSRGMSIVISRGVLESEYLRPVLAHELAHIVSLDARASQALERLVLWGDPFPPPEKGSHRQVTGLVTLFLWARRWLFRIAGGRVLLNLWPVRAAWAAYLRKRESAADASAAYAGQGIPLARYLKAYEQAREQPNPRLVFNLREYEPVAHRIAKLRRLAMEAPGQGVEPWREADYSDVLAEAEAAESSGSPSPRDDTSAG